MKGVLTSNYLYVSDIIAAFIRLAIKASLLAKMIYLTATTLVNSLGQGKNATWQAIKSKTSGLQPNTFLDAKLDTWIGRVADLESVIIDGDLAPFHCRNNQLALLCLQQDEFIDHVESAKKRYGAERIGVFIGTSTSGILQTELAFQQKDKVSGKLTSNYHYAQTHELSSVVSFVRHYLNLSGVSLSISTACSSSSKVFASASRAISAGLCDAAIVGGVDSLCMTTLYGFSSLELLSTQACRPSDIDRDGISIGEGAGFALLEKTDTNNMGIALLGYGESSDAHHMSTPHPEGKGAIAAMQTALSRANLAPQQIDYINLHGTSTRSNDAAEGQAVFALFGNNTATSSTKGWTGHTLGAAGITEAIISALCVENNMIPCSLNTSHIDPLIPIQILQEHHHKPINSVLSNSFGFGGSNCSLIIGRA